MELTLQEARSIANSTIFSKELPVRVSYRFARLGRALVEELKVIEEQRQKLITLHEGVLSEDKTQFSFSADHAEGFKADMDALLGLTIDVPFEPMFVEALGEVILTPNELIDLAPLFKDDEEATPSV